MKIAVFSDIHDRKEELRWLLDEAKDRGSEEGWCLGDLVSPFIALMLRDAPFKVYSVFGNNDGDKHMIQRMALEQGSQLEFSEREFGERAIGEKVYFLSHYPELAENAALSGKYQAVFHGHTHEFRNKKNRRCSYC